MEKYIMIFEDGQVYRSETFTDDDKKSVNSGVLEVIRQSDLKKWCEGDWQDIPVWGD